MTIEQDSKLVDWLYGIKQGRPTPPGSFLATLAEAALRADPSNYAILRPALLKIRAKYPEYSYAAARPDATRTDSVKSDVEPQDLK